MIQKKLVYLPVEITEEFWRKYDSGEEKPEYEIIDADTGERIDEWVNQQEGYFFTLEQLNEYIQSIIKQTLETAAKKAEIKERRITYNSSSGSEYDYVQSINKQSITNTFNEIYRLFSVE